MRITLKKASQLLLEGQVVGVPTETVYGLAASLSHERAIEQIFKLKGRPSNNPLIIHVNTEKEIQEYAIDECPCFLLLAKAFWPGPLTLVLPVKTEKISSKVRSDLPTAAFRIPGAPLTRQLLALAGPLVMPSANLSGKPSSTSCQHVEEDFGTAFPVLDGGPCHHGLESTILIAQQEKWAIIREGAIPSERFASILGYFPEVISKLTPDASPLCPGQLYRHYSPKAKLILTKKLDFLSHEVILGFNDRHYPSCCQVYRLGSLEKPDSIATNLYSTLRKLDEDKVLVAYVDANFPCEGLLSTISERLNRASNQTYQIIKKD